jgi:hypothetical protein
MKLPNPERASIPADKLEGYALNPNHSEGRHKAVVFRSALGLDQENAEELKEALRQALKTENATPTTRNPYGQKYQIEFEMIRAGRSAIIRSIWIVKDAENFPRLITCYIP